MGLFDKVAKLFKPATENIADDHCASSDPNWVPSGTWTPQFDDNGATPEAYDGN
jgi:hypothetical protein